MGFSKESRYRGGGGGSCSRKFMHIHTRSFPEIRGPFWGPHHKDYNILRSILGSPYWANYYIYIYIYISACVYMLCYETHVLYSSPRHDENLSKATIKI